MQVLSERFLTRQRYHEVEDEDDLDICKTSSVEDFIKNKTIHGYRCDEFVISGEDSCKNADRYYINYYICDNKLLDPRFRLLMTNIGFQNDKHLLRGYYDHNAVYKLESKEIELGNPKTHFPNLDQWWVTLEIVFTKKLNSNYLLWLLFAIQYIPMTYDIAKDMYYKHIFIF